jgi:hypothetical protein
MSNPCWPGGFARSTTRHTTEGIIALLRLFNDVPDAGLMKLLKA